jgi:hypothetical protein
MVIMKPRAGGHIMMRETEGQRRLFSAADLLLPTAKVLPEANVRKALVLLGELLLRYTEGQHEAREEGGDRNGRDY